MQITYYQLAVLGNIRTLNTLSHLLTKAAHYCVVETVSEEQLLSRQLFPDMPSLLKQVQLVCKISACCVARLTQVPAPHFADTERSFDELQATIDTSMAYLHRLSVRDLNQIVLHKIKTPLNPDTTMMGETFLLQHAVPNLYFHFTQVYTLLAASGVPLSKADFLGYHNSEPASVDFIGDDVLDTV